MNEKAFCIYINSWHFVDGVPDVDANARPY